VSNRESPGRKTFSDVNRVVEGTGGSFGAAKHPQHERS
jgi:hypothetical protein